MPLCYWMCSFISFSFVITESVDLAKCSRCDHHLKNVDRHLLSDNLSIFANSSKRCYYRLRSVSENVLISANSSRKFFSKTPFAPSPQVGGVERAARVLRGERGGAGGVPAPAVGAHHLARDPRAQTRARRHRRLDSCASQVSTRLLACVIIFFFSFMIV